MRKGIAFLFRYQQVYAKLPPDLIRDLLTWPLNPLVQPRGR